MKKQKKLENKEKGDEEKRKKQTAAVAIFMIALILTILLVWFIFQSSKKFEYAGLNFVKGKQGNLILYQAKVPLTDASGTEVSSFLLYLKEDPRKLKRINIEDKIMLKPIVAISASDDIARNCSDLVVSATTLALFLKYAGVSSFAATTNKAEAVKNNMTYVSCDKNNKYSVIEFKQVNETKITTSNYCTTLYFNNCEMLNVTERFMVGVYAQSQNIDGF